MPNYSLSISEIVEHNLPVICFDTCSLLDIIRDPTRKAATSDTGKYAQELLELFNNNRLAFVTMQHVTQELNDHADNIHDEAVTKITTLLKQIDNIQKINEIYNIYTPVLNLKHWKDEQPQRARDLFNQIVDASFIPEEGEDIHKKATQRVVQAIAPSSRAKDSLKDCLIIENFLSFSHQLRKSGHSSKICFTSSNKADFCAKSNYDLHPDLKSDFDKYNLDFTTNLGHATYLLK